jgi:hypothetical protein
MRENLAGPNAEWIEAERRHCALLAEIEGEGALVVEFDHGSGEIRAGEHEIARGPNALLLRRFLSEFTTRGRTEFERKEFIYDPAICPDRKRPNLEVRLERLQDSLRRYCPAVSIARVGRGKYVLHVAGTIRLKLSQEAILGP